ncbi:MAG: type II secretion system protein GspL [Tepidimonas sp.]|uniref:type II secretion system protein GspL n=1 Tax=Tepidimonas sp. TaxID=2002775 RepID=UPI00298F2641|nr:type II secretion system protein GspL [Tepidimonas sp.]MDW8336529.1 type II secretion system protein GspL [Tepidimonas sp.]
MLAALACTDRPSMLILRPALRRSWVGSSTPDTDGALWHWARLDTEGTVQAHGRAPTEALIELGTAQNVALVVPTPWLSWHWVQLPPGRLGRDLPALVGLLEEHLLDDPPRLHWALGPRDRSSQRCWVAVCRDEGLQEAVARLQAMGWTVQRLCAESTPGPRLTVWVHALDEQPTFVLSGPDGVAWAPLTDASELLHGTVAAPTVPGETSLPPASEAWADPACLDEARAALPHLPWQPVPAGARWNLALQEGADLAQFAWRHRIGGAWWQRAARALRAVATAPVWRATRWGLATAAAIPLLAVPALAWQARQAERALKAEGLRLARAALPDVPVLLHPSRQLAQALAQQSGPSRPVALERWLHAWGEQGGAAPLRLRLQDGVLELTWEHPPSAEALHAAARAAGLPHPQGADRVWRLDLRGTPSGG